MTKAPVARRAKCDRLTPDLEEGGRKPPFLSVAIGMLLRRMSAVRIDVTDPPH